jgi:[FeFe] hydrogenase H-cluster maturation GTPase HydF
MHTSPKGVRLHIGFFGRRNAGKSSILNALVGQQASIVSEVAGTTTDPVEKPMELLPLGPVLLIDTAGIDDAGSLGRRRAERTRQVFDRTDLGVLVAEAAAWGEFEDRVLDALRAGEVPAIVVFNKCDLAPPLAASQEKLRAAGVPWVETVATQGRGIDALREALVRAAPGDFLDAPPLARDLVPPGGLALLVVPIDLEAPKGRLILPQVQTIRDLLDGDALCMVVKQSGLRSALGRLDRPPALVVTDSQAFAEVAAAVPPEVPLTSFSILMARQKGDLAEFVRGVRGIDRLRPGDRVLVAESCTHHPIGDDIGRVKIPRWLERHVGGRLEFHTTRGRDFPDDLEGFKLVVHCGACMWNRREVLARMLRCRRCGVPVCNYGVTIAHTLGILERALGPFPDALETYRRLGEPQKR